MEGRKLGEGNDDKECPQHGGEQRESLESGDGGRGEDDAHAAVGEHGRVAPCVQLIRGLDSELADGELVIHGAATLPSLR